MMLIADSELKHVREMLDKGLVKNDETGLVHFTGYQNTTLYDWDQYFEGIVQLYAGWETKYMQNAIKIYLLHQQENGFSKRAIQNGYSGEEDYEMVKPFLSQIALLCFSKDKNLDWMDEDIFVRLGKSLDYWLFVRDENKNHLSKWRSSVETGMDDQHERGGRWKADYCEGVDLNSYLYRECLAYAKICEYKGKGELKNKYKIYAKQRKEAVQTLWDENEGIYYDRDERDRSAIKVKSVSCLLPMWAGIADQSQVRRMVYEHILNPNEFWRPYPLPALAASEPGYSSEHLAGDIGCNWRADTWIPTNYMVMHGLMDYGYHDIAEYIAYKTKELIRISGDREYYLTETGTGTGLDPFWGWSLLAYFMEAEVKDSFNPMDFNKSIPGDTFGWGQR